MDFTQLELQIIEGACRAQANAYRDLAAKADRPIQRNQRADVAQALEQIAEKIARDRRTRAYLLRGCPNCED